MQDCKTRQRNEHIACSKNVVGSVDNSTGCLRETEHVDAFANLFPPVFRQVQLLITRTYFDYASHIIGRIPDSLLLWMLPLHCFEILLSSWLLAHLLLPNAVQALLFCL